MTKTDDKYIGAIGRRKTAVASVRLYPGKKGSMTVNGGELATYFPTAELQAIATEALKKSDGGSGMTVSVLVRGGGINAQAEALRLGISRALVEIDPELRKELKKDGFLKRDPRKKERKKFGLKGARKAPQWKKR